MNIRSFVLGFKNHLKVSTLKIMADQDASRGQQPIGVQIVEPLAESTLANTLKPLWKIVSTNSECVALNWTA